MALEKLNRVARCRTPVERKIRQKRRVTPLPVAVTTFIAEKPVIAPESAPNCPKFQGCNANLCPDDPRINARTWFVGEALCKNPEHAESLIVVRQKQLNRLKPRTYLDKPLSAEWLIETAPVKRTLTPERRLQLQDQVAKARSAKDARSGERGGAENKDISDDQAESKVMPIADEPSKNPCSSAGALSSSRGISVKNSKAKEGSKGKKN